MKNVISTWAAYTPDDDVREKSSSGGVFFWLADYIINNNGIVYGVSMADDCRSAEYFRASDRIGISKLLGSKYVQAKIGKTFELVKNDLDEGRFVLFSGTGCIINGLHNFLRDDYKNLVCVDVICHGTPSPQIWEKYMDYIENKYNGKVSSVSFRCKINGWEKFGLSYTVDYSRFSFLPVEDDPYLQMFLKNLSLRPSCYECKAKAFRTSDLTLGDFWGIDKVVPEMNDRKGVSLVIVRTEKGETLFNCVSQYLQKQEVPYEDSIKDNSAEYMSVNKPDNRESFFHDAEKMSFRNLSNKYVYISVKKRIKRIILETPFRKMIWGGKA